MSNLLIAVLSLISVSLVTCSSISGTHQSRSVTFDDNYYVEGVIVLPYAEIHETFTAYYDGQGNRSRIDYYGDLVLTLQRGDVNSEADDLEGISYKIAYNVDSSGNPGRVCFQVNGSSLDPVRPQSALPDLSPFNYQGNDNCPQFDSQLKGSETCEKYSYTIVNGEKKSKYTFWLKRDQTNGSPIPVHYDMEGYNSLFGSHYDRYQVSYKNYRPQSVSSSAFELTINMTCGSFPGPGAGKIAHLHNPMSEFIADEDKRESQVTKAFESFKATHNKNYENSLTEEKKRNSFRHNHRFIESHNRRNVNYKLKVNHLADMEDSELRYMRGRLSTKGYNGGSPYIRSEKKHRPSILDWRIAGAVTPVKDQAVCGSCWSFGTIGTIEGVNFVKTGHLLRLSEQQLVDCSWDQGDNGCDGGEDFRAYKYLMRAGGVSLDEDYGSYLGQDGKCHDSKTPKAVKVTGFINVTSNDPEALELALFENGPVTVAIDASQKTFSFYSHGVYYDDNCGNTPDDLDHQVLAVGYGQLYGQKYWLIKNSWSTYWGNDGYILMAQKNNNCGVMTSPTYPIIA